MFKVINGCIYCEVDGELKEISSAEVVVSERIAYGYKCARKSVFRELDSFNVELSDGGRIEANRKAYNDLVQAIIECENWLEEQKREKEEKSDLSFWV